MNPTQPPLQRREGGAYSEKPKDPFAPQDTLDKAHALWKSQAKEPERVPVGKGHQPAPQIPPHLAHLQKAEAPRRVPVDHGHQGAAQEESRGR